MQAFQSPEATPRRIHLHVGPLCNNDCVFCLEDDRELRFVVNAAMNEARAREILEAHRGTPEVVFTSGEPTLLDDLPALARIACSLGYTQVGLMSNGRRLSRAGYAHALVDAGFNAFVVGLHGADASLHDALVQREGAFAQTVAGLEALVTLRGAGARIQIETSTVVVRANLEHLDAIYRLLSAVGVDAVRLDGLCARGRALFAFDELFPPYPEFSSQVRALIERGLAPATHLLLTNLPPCATVGIAPRHLPTPPAHLSFEVEDGAPSPLAARFGETTADGRFRILDHARVEGSDRHKGAACVSCRHESICPGIYSAYLEHHGWAGLDPIPASPDLH